MNPKRPTLRNTVIKIVKVKETALKAARENQLVMYKGNSIRILADFSAATLQAKKWQYIFKLLKKEIYNVE